MRILHLLPSFFALSTSLPVPTETPLLEPRPLNIFSIQHTPWPRAPLPYSLSTTLPLTMNIIAYGAPGPPSSRATELLKTLSEQISAGGAESDRILNHTESVAGITAKFTEAGTGAGITRLQAMTVLLRVWGLTTVHDAVGIRKCEIEMSGQPVGGFQLEYTIE